MRLRGSMNAGTRHLAPWQRFLVGRRETRMTPVVSPELQRDIERKMDEAMIYGTEIIRHPQCLVVLSGGMDSAVALSLAVKRFTRERVLTVSFDYGQRHGVEVKCAEEVST